MRSKERVLTFIEDWHFSGVCWMHIVQITKPVIRKVTRLILSQKKKKKEWSHYYWSGERNRHWLNIWALRLIWSREILLREILYLSFGFWGQFFQEQNLKVTFRHPDEIPASWTIIYMQLLLNTTEQQALRPQTFRIFWPFISSHYKYISRTYCSFKFSPRHGLFDWTRQVAVNTVHCKRSLGGLSADILRRWGLGLTLRRVCVTIVVVEKQ